MVLGTLKALLLVASLAFKSLLFFILITCPNDGISQHNLHFPSLGPILIFSNLPKVHFMIEVRKCPGLSLR
jgi:hypothetical protein